MTFAAPLVKGGAYTLQIAPTVADLAGNTLGPGAADSFQLTADTTPPTVALVTPTGIVATDITSITIAFNKAMAAGTITGSQVTITGPGGTIPAASITVTPIDSQTFKATFPAPTQDGNYNVALGTGITDISGNALAAPYQALFTIDTTPPQLTAVTPSGTVNTLITTIDLTFSKPVDVSTISAAVTLTGPNGPVTLGNPSFFGGTTYGIPVSALHANGNYTLAIGTGIKDPVGRSLGQAQNRQLYRRAAGPGRRHADPPAGIGEIRRCVPFDLHRPQHRRFSAGRQLDGCRLSVHQTNARQHRRAFTALTTAPAAGRCCRPARRKPCRCLSPSPMSAPNRQAITT